MNKYKSKSSNQVITITVVGCVILLSISIDVFVQRDYWGVWLSCFILFVLVSIPAYLIGSSVSYIELTDKKLIINKMVCPRCIKFKSIKHVKRIFYANYTMRIGSQGFFGYIGISMDGALINVKDRKKMVLIETDNGNFIISCENPEELVAELKKILQEL